MELVIHLQPCKLDLFAICMPDSVLCGCRWMSWNPQISKMLVSLLHLLFLSFIFNFSNILCRGLQLINVVECLSLQRSRTDDLRQANNTKEGERI